MASFDLSVFRTGAGHKVFLTEIIHFSHPDVNVSMLSTCRDEIIQDFSSATTCPPAGAALRLISQINTSYFATDQHRFHLNKIIILVLIRINRWQSAPDPASTDNPCLPAYGVGLLFLFAASLRYE